MYIKQTCSYDTFSILYASRYYGMLFTASTHLLSTDVLKSRDNKRHSHKSKKQATAQIAGTLYKGKNVN